MKWKQKRLKSEPFAQSASQSAQSLNPFLKSPLEVLPHTVDQKNNQNIMINSCFEHVLGRLPKLEYFVFSALKVRTLCSKWQGGALWNTRGANPLLKMAGWSAQSTNPVLKMTSWSPQRTNPRPKTQPERTKSEPFPQNTVGSTPPHGGPKK